jgi:hypothetical protein
MIKFGRHGVDVQGNLRRTPARRESSWRPFVSARCDEAIWLMAILGIGVLTLVHLVFVYGLWCLLWLADHVTGREA